MVALARLPGPSALWRAFMPISAAIGPLTTAQRAAPPVLVSTVCRLNAGSNIASSAATTTGKYAGRQPAMTAFVAAFSIVTPRPRAGRKPISSSGSVAPTSSSIASTRSGVGGTMGSPSVQPAGEELLLDVVLVERQRLAHQNARGSPRSSATRFRTIWFVIGPIW